MKKPSANQEEENFFNLIKNTYKNVRVDIIFSGEKLDTFPLKLETKKICPLSPLLFNNILATAIRKGNKHYTNWKRRNKTAFVGR